MSVKANHLAMDGFLTGYFVLTKSEAEPLLRELADTLGFKAKDVTVLCFTTSKSSTANICILPWGHILLHSISYEKAFSLDVLLMDRFAPETITDIVQARLPLEQANINITSRAFPPDQAKLVTKKYVNPQEQTQDGDMN